ncbi:MAG: cyclic nucleotide-binding domain-containing protein [Proteobacteria bacterium]|nr:cyclic nucleotide-binding domain-containing protein [Pseudomonadota bacterium]MBU1738095.1 cyclic nucleotide-binding domain-containing protein [Pseudomonadota bacterium]
MNLTDHEELKKYQTFYPAGSVIFSEGDQARDLYVLDSGRLDVVKGGKKISEIKEPDFFGELSFLLGTVRIASVVAVEDSRVLRFPSDEVNTLWRQYPEFGEHLAKILARRLHDTTNIAQGFREFCDRMPDAVIMTDTRHRVLSWNRAAEKLYGRSWTDMRDKPIEEVYDNQAAFHQFMAELPDHGVMSEKTLKINHPEKEWFFVSTSTTLLKDPHDNIQGYLFLSRDATSQQQLAVKHRRIKNWLPLLLLAVVILSGWIFWEHLSPAKSPGIETAHSPIAFQTRLADDIKALELALSPLLGQNYQKNSGMILAEYFARYQPSLVGIPGLMLLDRNRKVVTAHTPAHPECSTLIGKPYDGTRYPGENGNTNGTLAIYLAERPPQAGGRSIEAVVAISDRAGINQGWLVLRLDTETIEKNFSVTIKEIAAAL